MIKGSNKYEKLGESLQGFQNIESLANRLKIDRIKAIYVIHRLRKLGLVRTSYEAKNKRLYYISLSNKQKGISYTDKVNEGTSNPGIQLASFDSYYVHGRNPTFEEALIYALKQDSVRYVIASLALYRKISDWSFLYKLAKKNNLVREVAALYDISRLVVAKVKRMPKRFSNLAKPKRTDKYKYIVQSAHSRSFQKFEKKWKVYIPLDWGDLEEYKYI